MIFNFIKQDHNADSKLQVIVRKWEKCETGKKKIIMWLINI